MTYATPEELRARLRALGPASRTAADLDDDKLDDAIEDAAAEIDAALTSRYQLPTDPEAQLPRLVKALTIDVAAYLSTLTARGSSDMSKDDPVALRYARAQKLLESVASGSMRLPLPPAVSGSGDAYAVDTVPALNLAGDVAAPTYDGGEPAGWPGGPAAYLGLSRRNPTDVTIFMGGA